MPAEILVDTAGLVAWSWSGEEGYAFARRQWQALVAAQAGFLVPKVAFVEALSTLQKKLTRPPFAGRPLAVLVGQVLHDYQRTGTARFLDTTETQEREAWELYQEGKYPEMTLSDCLCVAIACRRKVSSIFSCQPFYKSFSLTPLLAE